jgi:hypothetical protein
MRPTLLHAMMAAAFVTTAAGETYKMTTSIPPSITAPAEVETRLGTLKFTDGFPDEATAEKCYDNLDFQHGVQAHLAAPCLLSR